MIYRTTFSIVILLIAFGSSGSEKAGMDCNDIPEYFTSYNEAQEIIFNAEYNYVDHANTSRSSWISHAGYLSCDGSYGFFFIETGSRIYIHQDVPIELWYGFKEADSFGSFYNYYIKGRYWLKIG